jgi:hypothetical protein
VLPEPFITYTGGGPATSGDLRSIGIIDLTGEQPFFVSVDQPPVQPTALYAQQTEGALYVLDDNTTIRLFDDPSAPAAPARWRSKRFVLPHLETFGVVLVETEESASEEVEVTTRIFADGVLVHSTTDFNAPARLPAGFLASRWEVEVEGSAEISAISLAGSIEELAQ